MEQKARRNVTSQSRIRTLVKGRASGTGHFLFQVMGEWLKAGVVGPRCGGAWHWRDEFHLHPAGAAIDFRPGA